MRDFDLDDILNEFQDGTPEETPAAPEKPAAREPEEPAYREERYEEPVPRFSRRQQTEPNPAAELGPKLKELGGKLGRRGQGRKSGGTGL